MIDTLAIVWLGILWAALTLWNWPRLASTSAITWSCPMTEAPTKKSPDLDAELRRMVDEGRRRVLMLAGAMSLGSYRPERIADLVDRHGRIDDLRLVRLIYGGGAEEDQRQVVEEAGNLIADVLRQPHPERGT